MSDLVAEGAELESNLFYGALAFLAEKGWAPEYAPLVSHEKVFLGSEWKVRFFNQAKGLKSWVTFIPGNGSDLLSDWGITIDDDVAAFLDTLGDE